MKKIVLALVVALGCANVYANDVVAPKQDDATKTFNTEVKRSVEALKLSKADQNVVMTWIKKHPVIVGTIAATALVAIVGGVCWYMSKDLKPTTKKDAKGAEVTVPVTETSKAAWIWSCYTAPYTYATDKAGKAWGAVKAHPYITAGSALAVVVVAAAVYDIAARGEESTLKALWKKATAEANKAQAPAQPAAI